MRSRTHSSRDGVPGVDAKPPEPIDDDWGGVGVAGVDTAPLLAPFLEAFRVWPVSSPCRLSLDPPTSCPNRWASGFAWAKSPKTADLARGLPSLVSSRAPRGLVLGNSIAVRSGSFPSLPMLPPWCLLGAAGDLRDAVRPGWKPAP